MHFCFLFSFGIGFSTIIRISGSGSIHLFFVPPRTWLRNHRVRASSNAVGARSLSHHDHKEVEHMLANPTICFCCAPLTGSELDRVKSLLVVQGDFLFLLDALVLNCLTFCEKKSPSLQQMRLSHHGRIHQKRNRKLYSSCFCTR